MRTTFCKCLQTYLIISWDSKESKGQCIFKPLALLCNIYLQEECVMCSILQSSSSIDTLLALFISSRGLDALRIASVKRHSMHWELPVWVEKNTWFHNSRDEMPPEGHFFVEENVLLYSWVERGNKVPCRPSTFASQLDRPQPEFQQPPRSH